MRFVTRQIQLEVITCVANRERSVSTQMRESNLSPCKSAAAEAAATPASALHAHLLQPHANGGRAIRPPGVGDADGGAAAAHDGAAQTAFPLRRRPGRRAAAGIDRRGRPALLVALL